MAVESLDRGLWREARSLHAQMLVVNGLDASGLSEQVLRTLQSGGVHANMTTLRLDVGSAEHRFLHECQDRAVKATSIAQIEAARRDNKIALIPCWQSVEFGRGRLDELYGFQALGLRSSGLVYNLGNAVGSGCLDPQTGPLSHFGVEVVRTLQELRIVVDVGGHTSEATGFDAIEQTRGPVVCTHANPRALRNVRRNITDELIRAIAQRGGVVGIPAFNFFLADQNSPAPRSAPLDEYLRHIDHVVQLVGDEHVGIGLDQIIGRRGVGPVDPAFFPADVYPQKKEDWIYVEHLDDFSGVPLITAGLMRLGYARERIERIMGLNWMRVWREVWGQ
ncbi:dipeptidase [Steroidobacter sp.]|uniref:dipeptidase n=1 Tax=Steroidobacter sp. TaxID=1978227 RepID=UPI001A4737D9|nr:membrane dipeptidase [Steroidobacter sp.]MBL8271335.1 membrane dipeptidase [Steroidobacter sp.]